MSGTTSSGRAHIPHYTGHVRTFVKHSVDKPVAFDSKNRHTTTVKLSTNENVNTNNQSVYASSMVQLPVQPQAHKHGDFAKAAFLDRSVVDTTSALAPVAANQLWKSTYNHTYTPLPIPAEVTADTPATTRSDDSKLHSRGVNQILTSYDRDYGRAAQRTQQLNNLSSTHTSIDYNTQYNNILSTQADLYNGTAKDIHNVNAKFNIPPQYTGYHPTSDRNKAKFTGQRTQLFTSTK